MGRSIQHLGVGQRGDRRDVDRPRGFSASCPKSPRSPAAPGIPALTEGWSRDDPELELAVDLECEQRSEQRDPADEVVGPVDRVDVPATAGRARLRAVFLANQAVLRIRRQDPLADEPFNRLVGHRHEGTVRLGHDLQVAPEVEQRKGVSCVAGSLGESEPGIELNRGNAGARCAPGRAAGDGSCDRRGESRLAGFGRGRHARIRSPAGSKSGSVATSKPIHSPKTSISPRVPIAA